jgi:hypothetical protein
LSIALKSILGLGALVMASCSTIGAKEESEKLVGHWRSTDERHVAEYVFLGNGSFSGFVAAEGSMLSQFTGKWLLRDGSIRYEYTGDRMGRIPSGTRDRDKLLRIGRDYFVIEAADGSVRKYVRANNG